MSRYYIKALDKTLTDSQLAQYIPKPDQIYRKMDSNTNAHKAYLYKILKTGGYVAYSKTTADFSNTKSLYTNDDTHAIIENNSEHAVPLLDWIEYSISEGLELLSDDSIEAYNDISRIIKQYAIDIVSRIESVPSR